MKLLIEEIKEHIDVSDALRRLGNNVSLYEKVLKAYLEDRNGDAYFEWLEQKDYQNAYRCVHTIKGLAANLGMNHLEKLSKQSADYLKVNHIQGALQLASTLKDEQREVRTCVQKMLTLYQKGSKDAKIT